MIHFIGTQIDRYILCFLISFDSFTSTIQATSRGKKSQNNSESDNDTYCSDGDTTVDVGGAIQRIETNAVPEQVGNPCMSQSGKATTVWSRVCNYKSKQSLTSHEVPGRRIWPPRSLQTQERTARNKPKVSAQAFVPPGTCECLSSELKRWWFFLMGKTWERVRMCRRVHYGAAAADERLDKDLVGQHIELLPGFFIPTG